MNTKTFESPIELDVAVIGGGPAGISAGLELSQNRALKVALFERDDQLGGIPRSCHYFFGMRDRRRLYSGAAYARTLDRLIRKAPVPIYTRAMVLNLRPGSHGEMHRFEILSPGGLFICQSRVVLLATGCFESSRHHRMIPGTRPAGVFSTGTLQQMVNIDRRRFPGRRAVIVGSEHVAFSSVLTLRRAGTSIAAMVEACSDLHTYTLPAEAMRRWFGFPVYKNTSIDSILGNDVVEGVSLVNNKTLKRRLVPCDMVVVTGKFEPESSLIDNTPIERDPATGGPAVNSELLTSIPDVYAAGNILRGADMHDLCALEGRRAARSIIRRLAAPAPVNPRWISIEAEPPVRHVVPQQVDPGKIARGCLSWLDPGPGFQVRVTLKNTVLEAVSGNRRIWQHPYRRLIANNRYSLPLDRFDWSRMSASHGIILRIRQAVG